MKPYITGILATIGLITLFSLQLCLLAYEQHTQFNPLLITYVYILLTNCSMTILTTLALMLDAIIYLSIGMAGITILFLVPASWLALKIKNDMYNKIVIPCLFIVLYVIFYNITLYTHLHHPFSFGQMIWAIVQNFLAFMSLWWITKQPIHD